ncbi:twin transmembrane helix small protein [Caulobacter sp. S45]|uniref:twin transmembrane helix small protein n=1 Tax=Caulobacter sp. S45 TaxID=1641861 RepID=UPI00131E6CC7|nr:twin transmembrane helix small protein [Caulobacter sp. S45]
MDIFINILIAVAMLAVVASLGLGVFSMLKGGEYARANSNKFMRYRVMSQAVAIVLIVIGFIYKASHH